MLVKLLNLQKAIFKNMEKGTKEDPWQLKTPPNTSAYYMYKGTKDNLEVIYCVVGSTTLI